MSNNSAKKAAEKHKERVSIDNCNRQLEPLMLALQDLAREIEAIKNAPWYVKLWWRLQTLVLVPWQWITGGNDD